MIDPMVSVDVGIGGKFYIRESIVTGMIDDLVKARYHPLPSKDQVVNRQACVLDGLDCGVMQ